MSILTDKRWKDSERRAHPRHDVSYPVNVEAELFGYDRESQSVPTTRRPDSNQGFNVSGVTINLSRGGMLVSVEQPLPVGTYCLVHFPQAEGLIEPEFRWGTVIRSEDVDGVCQMSVKFHSPLEVLEVDALSERQSKPVPDAD